MMSVFSPGEQTILLAAQVQTRENSRIDYEAAISFQLVNALKNGMAEAIEMAARLPLLEAQRRPQRPQQPVRKMIRRG